MSALKLREIWFKRCSCCGRRIYPWQVIGPRGTVHWHCWVKSLVLAR